ncbi:MAG: methyl-accepting chemotaxis protein [Fimbriimonadaceae bacterium]|nr:methyl-accepting chemotaxis protein [Fimbriimonadaceae bacterium]
MKWLSNLRIGRKLALSFGMCIGLMAVLGVVAFVRLNQLGGLSTRLAGEFQLAQTSGELSTRLLQFVRSEKNHILADTPAQMGPQRTHADGDRKDVEAKLEELKKEIFSPEGKVFLSKLDDLLPKYFANAEEVFKLSESNQKAKAETLSRSARPILDDIDESLSVYNKYNDALIVKEKQVTKSILFWSKATVITLLLFAIVVAILFAVIITRMISSALAEIGTAAKGLAVGDINQEIKIETKDEIGDLATEFKSLILHQRDMASIASAAALGDLSENVEPKSEGDVLGLSFATMIEHQRAMAEIAQTVASGDLTVSVQAKSENDSLGNAFATMILNLRELIKHVGTATQAVALSSDSLNSAASETSSGSEEIAQTIQQVAKASSESAQTSGQIARGSEQLASGATSASDAMEKLEEAILQVQEGSHDQQLAASRANEIAMEGGQAVQQTISSMDRISKQVALSEQAVRELGQRQAQIGAIVQTIDEIAEQTNLLALNAAIEAARAGEHGRGFAVVAEEVRKLAERSSASTKEIADLISMIREGVENAIDSMTTSAQQVTEGTQASDAAKAALTEILDGIASVQTLAEKNGALVEGIGLNTRTVVEAIANVASVSEETAAGAEQMSAAAEETAAATEEASAAIQQQVAAIADVSRMSEDLRNTAQKLQDIVAKFKVEPSSNPVEVKQAA